MNLQLVEPMETEMDTAEATDMILSQPDDLAMQNGQPTNLTRLNGSWNWNRRRLRLAALYNRTLTARGFDKLPLDSKKLHTHTEAWERELRGVPTELLDSAYAQAAAGHNWDQPFRPSKVRLAWLENLRAERANQELRRLQATNTLCPYCGGCGTQQVWQWDDAWRWSLRARGCACEWAGHHLKHDQAIGQIDREGQLQGNSTWLKRLDRAEFVRAKDVAGLDRFGKPRGFPTPATDWPPVPQQENDAGLPF